MSANGETVKSSTCGWGETVGIEFTATEANTYAFSLLFSNDAGESRPSALTMWVGKDTPSAVTNVKATRQGTINTVTWEAPHSSVHGGYVDFDAVTYTVTRMPDVKVVASGISATSYADNLPDGNSPEAYTYDVQACWDGFVSQAQKSNIVMAGVVYYNSFDEQSQFDEFISASLVQEGPTWSYASWHHAASVGYSEEGAVSAWLMSPALDLVADTEYTLSFLTWCSNDSYDELLSVFVTDSNVPAVIYGATPVISKQVVNWESTSKRTITATFTPKTSGKFYITFNGCSPRDYGTLYLDDVMFYRTPTAALPAASGITAELEGDNALDSRLC